MDQDVSAVPEVAVRGPGEPVAAIVGGIHGDEPSGVRAVRRLLDAEARGDLDLTRAVKFVVANPPALAGGRRYLDVDMNRTFPGNPAGNREERLAASVCDHVESVPTLALHSTRSQDEPFAIVQPTDTEALDLARQLPFEDLVLSSEEDVGSLSTCGSVVTVEVGRQGTDKAADNAESISRTFLSAVGALEGRIESAAPTVYRLGDAIDKPAGESYETHVKNFTHVPAGETIATVDGEEISATESFYPVLFSATGYADIFGFTSQKVADALTDVESVSDEGS